MVNPVAAVLGSMKKLTRSWKEITPDLGGLATSERKEPESWSRYAGAIEISGERNAYYRDYDEMDREITELSSALDVYADFIVSGGDPILNDEFTVEMTPESKEGEKGRRVEKISSKLDRKIELKSRVWNMARNLAKYGDAYYEIVVNPYEVVKLKNLSPYTMFYNLDEHGELIEDKPYKQVVEQILSKKVAEFEPWEIVHFKSGEDDYGAAESVLSRCRRTFKIVRMMEDSVLVSRLTRAHQRLVFKVDVTNMGVMEGQKYVEKLRNEHKSRRYVDSDGKLRTEANPLRPQEDIWLPVRKERTAGVDSISGDTSVTSIADIEHFHNKLFAGTRVPKAYLGFERDVNAKATLGQQHLAFAKVVSRFRAVMSKGLKQIYKVEWLMHGIDPNSFEWSITFPGLGSADDQIRWEIEEIKARIIKSWADLGVGLPIEWVLRKLFMNLSPADMEEIVTIWKSDPKVPCVGGQNPYHPKKEEPEGVGKAASPRKRIESDERRATAFLERKLLRDPAVLGSVDRIRGLLSNPDTRERF